MKKIIITIIAIVVILCAVLIVLNWNAIQLWCALSSYNRMLDSELPEDLTLTIYYVPADVLTRAPLTVDRLKKATYAVKIVVPSGELSKHIATLKRLDSSTVHSRCAGDTHYLNARFYYVFATKSSEELEVVMESFAYESGMNAFVNGIEVKSNPVLYEIVLPFLSDEDRSALRLNDLDSN